MRNITRKIWTLLTSKSVAITSLYAFIMLGLGALSAFIMSTVVSRVLGANESGYFFLILALITVLSVISRLGLDQTILRFTSDGSNRGASVMHKALAAAFLLSILIGSAIYFCADFLANTVFGKPELKEVIECFVPALPFIALFTLTGIGLQGFKRIVWSVFTLHIGVVLFFVPFVIFLGITSASDAALYYSLSAFITFFVGYFSWKKAANEVSKPEAIQWKVMYFSFLPLWIFTVMSSLSQWSSQLIAGIYVPPDEIAWIAVAQRTALLTSVVLMAVNMVVAPRFAALHRYGRTLELKRLAISSVRVMLLISIPVATMLFIFADKAMSIFGQEFIQGAGLLRVYVVGQFVNVATGSVGFLLSMTGHERDLRNNALISGFTTLALSFLLIPTLGVIGSAYSTAVAVSVQNLICVYWVKRRLGFNILAIWKFPRD